jgi:hypothetical protein
MRKIKDNRTHNAHAKIHHYQRQEKTPHTNFVKQSGNRIKESQNKTHNEGPKKQTPETRWRREPPGSRATTPRDHELPTTTTRTSIMPELQKAAAGVSLEPHTDAPIQKEKTLN